MSGPCSLPNGPKAEWERLNEVVCNMHVGCTPSRPKKSKDETKELNHEFITMRIWLAKRNRLRTGKTR